MTPRDNLIAALDGRQPERIAYTVNQEFVTDNPAWEALFDAGLCPIPYVHTVHEERNDVERVVEAVNRQGQSGRRVTLRTSQGEERNNLFSYVGHIPHSVGHAECEGCVR